MRWSYAIMGPNGAGEISSKLLRVILPRKLSRGPDFEVNFKSKDLLEMEPERAHEGVFLAFQYPIEPGCLNLEFLRTSFNAICRHQGVQEMKRAICEVCRGKADMLVFPKNFLTES